MHTSPYIVNHVKEESEHRNVLALCTHIQIARNATKEKPQQQ